MLDGVAGCAGSSQTGREAERGAVGGPAGGRKGDVLVDVVIGVDTHVHTHSAAVIDSATGGVLGEITVAATAAGYAELVEFANSYPMMRAWVVNGRSKERAVTAPA